MRFIKQFQFLAIIFFNINYVISQASEDCIQTLSIFAEFAKVKNYDSAFEPWMKVRENCSKINPAIYSYGERILKDKIKKTTGEELEFFKNDLIKLYDEWVQNFPKQRNKTVIGKIISSKAQTMLDLEMKDLKTIYEVFDKAFKTDPDSFSNPKHLYNYFKTLYDRYKENDNEVSMELLINKYEELSEKIENESVKLSMKLDVILEKEEQGSVITTRETRNKIAYESQFNAIETYLKNLDVIIQKEATCYNLIPLYKKNFEEKKTDVIWLKRAVNRMDGKECSDDPFFVTLVETWYGIEQSAGTAYYLGLLKDKTGESAEALKYYKESIALETDKYKKAKILLKIANRFKKVGRKVSARTYALRALSNQPSLGKAYLLIASLYADSANDCGENQFNKRAIYWLAAQTAIKAGRVDASLKRSAFAAVNSYNGRAPTKTDIFTEGNEGSTIKIDCWIKSSVKVPKL
jgi:tetratricopeptide (TPR) repeat protein